MKQILASEFAEAGFGLIGTPYAQMDCQAFWEECRKLCGDYINKKGSNAWYRTMTWVGTPEECIRVFGEIPKGATLFIHAFDGGEEKVGYHDGKGNASHIGIVTHKGKGAIHSGSRSGVSESAFADKTIRNGGWNCVGLWAEGFDYGDRINQLLNSISGGTTPTPHVDTKTAQVWSENGRDVKLRSLPSKAGKLYDLLPVGTVVEVLGEDGSWTQVNYGSRHGWWIMGEFLKPVDGKDHSLPKPATDVDGPCTVIIEWVSEALAQEIQARYPKARITRG